MKKALLIISIACFCIFLWFFTRNSPSLPRPASISIYLKHDVSFQESSERKVCLTMENGRFKKAVDSLFSFIKTKNYSSPHIIEYIKDPLRGDRSTCTFSIDDGENVFHLVIPPHLLGNPPLYLDSEKELYQEEIFIANECFNALEEHMGLKKERFLYTICVLSAPFSVESSVCLKKRLEVHMAAHQLCPGLDLTPAQVFPTEKKMTFSTREYGKPTPEKGKFTALFFDDKIKVIKESNNGLIAVKEIYTKTDHTIFEFDQIISYLSSRVPFVKNIRIESIQVRHSEYFEITGWKKKAENGEKSDLYEIRRSGTKWSAKKNGEPYPLQGK